MIEKDGYEFGYAIGTLLSDGYVQWFGRAGEVELEVKNGEYADIFRHALKGVRIISSILYKR